MIDIENLVVDTIQSEYERLGKNVYVVSDYIESPEEFPCVMIYEMNNATYQESLDTSLMEHHARLSYQVDIFSNSKDDGKGEVKELQAILDEAMQKMKFVRQSFNYTPNIDRSICRSTARYSTIIGEGIQNDGDITHQVYR